MHSLLTGHECKTAQQMGWGGKKNGELLKVAETSFDLFVTSDQNIRYQQNLANRRIAIIELSTNKLRRIQNAGHLLVAAINAVHPGDFVHLKIP
jgi:hypothetical protein